jgi:HK97 gp10 family phage protein
MSIKFTSHAPEVLDGMKAAAARALETCGGVAEGHAKRACPVDTGNLRNSITHQQIDEKTELIGSAVSYASFVELGTVKMRARPYLRPAVENHRSEYQAIIKQEMSR